MKLYYFPGACSQAVHIVAAEAGLPFELVRVDTKDPAYRSIHPLGYVPVLELDDGSRFTEAAVLVQMVADMRPEANLLSAPGTSARWREMEALGFLATELHKTFRPLIKGAADEVKAYARELLPPALDALAARLGSGPYLFGDRFTAVDAYQAVTFGWTRFVKFDTTAWPTLNEHLKRVRARDKVREVLRSEGLLKE